MRSLGEGLGGRGLERVFGSGERGWGVGTWITYHPVLPAHGADCLLIVALPLTPGEVLAGSNRTELSVQLRALVVVGFQALAPMCAECVLIQWVHVDGRTDLVDGTEVCGRVSGETLPEG